MIFPAILRFIKGLMSIRRRNCSYFYHKEFVLTYFVVIIASSSVETASGSQVRCNSSDDFFFNHQPEGTTVREGAPAFLECNVSNTCNVQFHWTLNEQPIDNTSRRYQNGSNLVIARVNKTLDGGEFHCIATIANTGHSKQSHGAVLSILWINDHVTVTSSQDAVGSDGTPKNVRLQCNVNASGDYTIRWYLNGRKIDPNSHERFSLDRKSGQLIIDRPTFNENGVYACEGNHPSSAVKSRSNFILNLAYNGLPKILTLPKDVLVKLDDSAVFDCVFDGVKPVWKKVDREDFLVNVSSRIRQYSNGSLFIVSVKKQDEGTYECIGYGKNGMVHSYSATLTIANLHKMEKANFLPTRDYYVIGQNKRFEVTCVPPSGLPTPKAYWTKNQQILTNTGRMRIVDDLRLIVDAAIPEDAGVYECVAENLAGQVKAPIRLYVTTPPRITVHPSSTDVEEGERVEFKCGHTGGSYPVTTVEWEKTGEMLNIGPRNNRLKMTVNNGTLIIDQVTVNDAGHYKCVVKTGDQEPVYSIPATLFVREKLKFAPKPVHKKLTLGADAQIPCKATGHIQPVVKWFRLENSLPYNVTSSLASSSAAKMDLNNNFPPNVRDKNGILYFKSVRFEDAGQYMCTAASTQGYLNETINVEVYVFPTILQGPKNLTVSAGADILFHCIADGYPPPKAEWYFENVAEPIGWSFTYERFANNSILLHNVSSAHAGKYICVAGNKGGFDRQEGIVCIRSEHDWSVKCGQNVPPVHRLDDWSSNDRSILTSQNGGGDQQQMDAAASESSVSSSTIALAAGIATGYLLLVLLLVLYCGYRRRRISDKASSANRSDQEQQLVDNGQVITGIAVYRANGGASGHNETGGDEEVLLSTTQSPNTSAWNHSSENGHVTSSGGGHQSSSKHSHNRKQQKQQQLLSRSSPTSLSSVITGTTINHRLQYARTSLEYHSLLGSGVFGEVRLMKISTNRNHPSQSQVTSANDPDQQMDHANQQQPQQQHTVVVKLFNNNKDEQLVQELNREIEMYSKLSHANIVKLIGVCVEKEPILVIYEYLEYGNLKHYLHASRAYKNNGVSPGAYPPPLSHQQIISTAYQVALGLEFLTDQGFVHKDVAARNILIAPNLAAKLSSLSLSNDAFLCEYYTYRNVVLPLRWMPDEAFLDDQFSAKSDAWSYGVFVWEMYTLGELPYQTWSNDEVIERMKRRELKLTPPPVMSQPIRNLLQQCWSPSSENRPTFAQIRETFQQMLTSEVDV